MLGLVIRVEEDAPARQLFEVMICESLNRGLPCLSWKSYIHTYMESSNLYLYSKFEIPIIFILSNMYDAVDFDSPEPNIYSQAHNKYYSLANTKILTKSLSVCSA